MPKISDEFANMHSRTFKNSHGEPFTISTDGIFTVMSGSEVDAMVDDAFKIDGKYLPLFNSALNIFSTDELEKIGTALVDLAKEIKNGKN